MDPIIRDKSILDFAEKIRLRNIYEDEIVDELLNFLKTEIPRSKNHRDKYAEEIFKLGIDLGLDSTYCRHLRQKVRSKYS